MYSSPNFWWMLISLNEAQVWSLQIVFAVEFYLQYVFHFLGSPRKDPAMRRAQNRLCPWTIKRNSNWIKVTSRFPWMQEYWSVKFIELSLMACLQFSIKGGTWMHRCICFTFTPKALNRSHQNSNFVFFKMFCLENNFSLVFWHYIPNARSLG